MAHTYEELKKQTVAQLKELAKENDHEALHGYSTMHKEDLVLALCKALGVDAQAGSADKEEVKEQAQDADEVKIESVAKEEVEAEGAEKEPVKAASASKEKVKAKSAGKEPATGKAKIKAQIAKLKEKRAAALEAHDSKQLKFVRRNIHALKHKLRKATV